MNATNPFAVQLNIIGCLACGYICCPPVAVAVAVVFFFLVGGVGVYVWVIWFDPFSFSTLDHPNICSRQ